jgi:hypothetical protein
MGCGYGKGTKGNKENKHPNLNCMDHDTDPSHVLVLHIDSWGQQDRFWQCPDSACSGTVEVVLLVYPH